jgi:hypothetical protein
MRVGETGLRMTVENREHNGHPFDRLSELLNRMTECSPTKMS